MMDGQGCIIFHVTRLKLSDRYFDVEIGFNLAAHLKLTSHTTISISRGQTERHFAGALDSAL